jgi:hypothetical protein
MKNREEWRQFRRPKLALSCSTVGKEGRDILAVLLRLKPWNIEKLQTLYTQQI